MKTLILNGSPRPNGDTVSLISEVTSLLEGEYRIVTAYRCDVAPCVDCRYCWTHTGCCIEDEMQGLYDDIETCDNLLIASPVYYGELTGKLLDLCSRLQIYYAAGVIQKKPIAIKHKRGAALLVGGGDGALDRANETATMILKQLRCKERHELVYSHDTNHRPAIKDFKAVAGAHSIAAFFNRI